MAKASSKKSTKKAPRHYPVQRMFQLKDQSSVIAGGRYLMGAHQLSTVNRRLYRQSRVYSMKLDVEPGSQPATAGVAVYVLRDTWDMHGAYKYAMKMYYNAMKEELQAKGAQTRWHDFRVIPDFQADGLNAVVSAPSTGTATMVDNTAGQGEFDSSSVVDQSGNTRVFSLHSQATSATQFGILEEWSRLDRVDADPQSSDASLPYSGLNPGQDEANYDLLRAAGSNPPYATTSETSIWRRVGVIKETPSGVSKLSTGFFDAPLGIVVLVSTAFTTDDQVYGMHVTFQAGDYKGVKAPAYATPVLTEAKEYEVV